MRILCSGETRVHVDHASVALEVSSSISVIGAGRSAPARQADALGDSFGDVGVVAGDHLVRMQPGGFRHGGFHRCGQGRSCPPGRRRLVLQASLLTSEGRADTTTLNYPSTRSACWSWHRVASTTPGIQVSHLGIAPWMRLWVSTTSGAHGGNHAIVFIVPAVEGEISSPWAVYAVHGLPCACARSQADFVRARVRLVHSEASAGTAAATRMDPSVGSPTTRNDLPVLAHIAFNLRVVDGANP